MRLEQSSFSYGAQIDVLEVDGKIFGFSGCHRFEVGILLSPKGCIVIVT